MVSLRAAIRPIEGRAVARPSGLPAAGRFAAAWLPAVPLLALAVALLVLPTAAVLVLSLRQVDGGIGLGAWTETLSRRGDQRAILTSLLLGFATAAIATLVGAPLAWALNRAGVGARAAWLALLNVAANIGGIALAFAYTAVLGAYGMLTLALQHLGAPVVPPPSASFAGLLIAYLYTNVPLFVLLTLPAMGTLEREWFEAADILGANRWQFWRFIGVPVLAPFLAAGWLLVFTWSVGLYGIAYALAGAAPTSPVRLMTLQIGIALNSSTGGQGRAAVMSTLLLLFAACCLLAYRATLRRALRWFA